MPEIVINQKTNKVAKILKLHGCVEVDLYGDYPVSIVIKEGWSKRVAGKIMYDTTAKAPFPPTEIRCYGRPLLCHAIAADIEEELQCKVTVVIASEKTLPRCVDGGW